MLMGGRGEVLVQEKKMKESVKKVREGLVAI